MMFKYPVSKYINFNTCKKSTIFYVFWVLGCEIKVINPDSTGSINEWPLITKFLWHNLFNNVNLLIMLKKLKNRNKKLEMNIKGNHWHELYKIDMWICFINAIYHLYGNVRNWSSDQLFIKQCCLLSYYIMNHVH